MKPLQFPRDYKVKGKCQCSLCKFTDIRNKFAPKLTKTELAAVDWILNKYLHLSEDISYIRAYLDKSWPISKEMTDVELLSFIKKQFKNIDN